MRLGECIFFGCAGPTNPNFWQIKIIIIILISNKIIFYYLFFCDIFLGYNNIGKKVQLSALDIVESWIKKMWSLSYVTSTINIFNF